MKINFISINNIRSYRDQNIEFNNGITVITGPNGSGKSSSLDALFIALYGNKAIVDKDRKISDIINNSSNEGSCKLDFTHFGHDYSIERVYTIGKNGNASNKKSLLKRDGSFFAEQFGMTYEKICQILNMDEDSFRNCVYIRQGEIDILINAAPTERQKMIDDLLQIGKLEEYHSRLKDATTGINRLLRDTNTLLKDRSNEMEQIEETDPYKTLSTLKTQESHIKSELDQSHNMRTKLIDRINVRNAQISDYESYSNDKTELETKIENTKKQKQKIDTEIKELSTSIDSLRQNINELDTSITQLQEKAELQTRPDMENIENILESQNERITDLYTHLKKKENEHSSVSDTINSNIQLKEKYESDITDIKEQETEHLDEISRISSKMDEYQEKLKLVREKLINNFDKAGMDSITDLEDHVKELNDQLQSLTTSLNDERTKAQSIDYEIRNSENSREQYVDQLNTLDETIHNIQEQLKETESKIEMRIEELDRTKKDIGSCLETIRSKLEDIGIDIELPQQFTRIDLNSVLTDLADKRLELAGYQKQFETRLTFLKEQIDKDESLLNKGICPTCEQKIDETHFHNELDTKNKEVAEINEKIERVNTALDNNTSVYETVKETLSIYDTNIPPLESSLNTIETSISHLKEKVTTLKKSHDESIQRKTELNEKIKGIDESVSKLKTQKEEVSEQVSKLGSEHETLKTELETYSSLLDQLRTDHQDRKDIESELKYLDKTRSTLNETIQKGHDKIESLKKEIQVIDAKITELRSTQSKLNEEKEMIEQEYGTQRVRLSVLKQIKTDLVQIDSYKRDIHERTQKITANQETIHLLTRQIQEYQDSVKKLETKLGDIQIEQVQSKLAELKNSLGKLDDKIEQKNQENNEIQQKLGHLHTTIEHLKSLQDNIDVLDQKKEYLESVLSDIETLDETYMQTRTEIRTKNINILNKYINEMFNLMSVDNAYSHVLLDNDYHIEIYDKEGSSLSPNQLSGGERAILNIVFRCAIYRLLAHGFGHESSESLPPIIMDEPTTFLDREHIKQLIQLLDTMRSLGVNQIIVVTHDDTLIDAADSVYRVDKDPSTNISHMVPMTHSRPQLFI